MHEYELFEPITSPSLRNFGPGLCNRASAVFVTHTEPQGHYKLFRYRGATHAFCPKCYTGSHAEYLFCAEVIPATTCASRYPRLFSRIPVRNQCCQHSNSLRNKDCPFVAIVVSIMYTSSWQPLFSSIWSFCCQLPLSLSVSYTHAF